MLAESWFFGYPRPRGLSRSGAKATFILSLVTFSLFDVLFCRTFYPLCVTTYHVPYSLNHETSIFSSYHRLLFGSELEF